MEVEEIPRGIFALPNEILLNIFSFFPTRMLLSWTPTCQHFHSLIVRILHRRLQVAAGLNDHTLYLECGPPALRYSTSRVPCALLCTEGLETLLNPQPPNNPTTNLGRIKSMGELYSRFKPQRHLETDLLRSIPRPPRPGDIPGSRTYIDPSSSPEIRRPLPEEDRVTQTVSVDSHSLFTQLETVAYLGKRDSTRGLLSSLQTVCDGTIRVWRDWLARRCERKRWTDGELIEVHRGESSGEKEGAYRGGGSFLEPYKDPSVLWTSGVRADVGIRFRVREQKWRRENPILFASEIEVPVSYVVEFDELLIRTTHLLLKSEDAQMQNSNSTGKAIVFGHFIERS